MCGPRMVKAPHQLLGHNMQCSGCKRSWRHNFGHGGSSEGVQGTMGEVLAYGIDWKNDWI